MAKIPGARAWLLVTALCAISGIAYEAGKPAEEREKKKEREFALNKCPPTHNHLEESKLNLYAYSVM